MTLEDAIKILDEALQPQMEGKITRQGWVRVDEAMKIVKQAIQHLKEVK